VPPADPLSAFAAATLDLPALQEVLVAFVETSLGARAVRELAPLASDEVRDALARVGEIELLERAGERLGLGGVTDPAPLVEAAREGPLDEAEVARLRGFLAAVERLGHWLERRAGECPRLGRLGADLPDLSALRERVDAVVDERGRVVDTASPLLARLRSEERELARKIDSTLRHLATRDGLKQHLSDHRPHLRGGRLCLAVKAQSSGRVRGIVHDRSQSDRTAFIEPREAVEPQNRLADCRTEERRELARILSELARDIGREAERVGLAAKLLARLELALVSARFAEAFEARVPLLPGEAGASPGLLLRSARHPLLMEELRRGRLAEVVPIDLRLGEDFDLLVITGPNTGGKTLALKTAGLLVLMTRLGLPLPCAEGTTVPLYAGIAADIGDEQELSQSLSTFSSHLLRIRAGLERADADTLVLIDELGGGTDPDEGAALGDAILSELLARGAPTLVSTHLGRLKEFAYRNKRAENACAEFDLETLAPRYRLVIGIPGDSAALIIARRLGLSAELCDAAGERLERRDEQVSALLAEVRDVRTEAERVRSLAESRLADAAQVSREAGSLRDDLERRGEQLEAEAQRGLEERVREARGALLRAEALLEQVPGRQRAPLAAALADAERALTSASLTERRQAFLEGLKKGDLVYLPRYRRRCPVHKVDRAGEVLVVKLGSVKLEVAFGEVTPFESL
jgi:DNA mismatch repair protein MutS2